MRHVGYGLDGLNYFVAAMQTGFGVFVTVYLVSNQWAPEAIGLALTISTLSSPLSQVPAGVFVDSLTDKRRAVRLGVIGVGVAALLIGSTPAKPAVYAAEALQGLASSLIGPGIAAISLAFVGQAAFTERVGRNARFASIGNGLTSAVMVFAASYFTPVAIFWVTAALTAPALLSLALVRLGRADMCAGSTAGKAQATQHEKLTWSVAKTPLYDRRLLIFAAAITLYFFSSAAIMPMVAGQITERRQEIASLLVAATILLPQAIAAIISPWVGRTAEHSGRRPLLLFGWGLLPFQCLLFATFSGPYAVVVGQVLSGFSGAVFGVMVTVVAQDLTRGTGRFNLTLAILGVAMSLGASVSTLFAGTVESALGGATPAYIGLALVGLLGILLPWFRMPETRRQLVMPA